MSGTRLRLTPPLPWLSHFPELNVRTYVTADGKPGVWFFSLDAARRLPVRGARLAYHLPYHLARMRASSNDDWIDYTSNRASGSASPATFHARYRPTGPVYRANPANLDHWLTERYCLYAAGSHNRTWRADIHHAPWPLQPAEADVRDNTMTRPLDIPLPDRPPLLHFAKSLDTFAWWPEPVST